MAVYSPISHDELLTFLTQYNIGELQSFEGILEGIENTNYKILTSTNTYILTIFEKRVKKEDLPFFMNLKNHLANKNFLCPKPIPDNNGTIINSLKDKPCVLISFLTGSKAKVITPHHCKQVGKNLSLLHHETSDFTEERSNSLDYTQWKTIFEKCQTIPNHNYIQLCDIIEKEFFFLKNNWPISLPQGIIHADVFQDNVFFIDNQFSGLIDFYFSCKDYLAYDIALTINAWCFDEKEILNQEKLQQLLAGYESLRELKTDEKDSLSILLRGAALRILVTRLHDQLFHPPGAYVTPKDPNEYGNILTYHQHNNIKTLL